MLNDIRIDELLEKVDSRYGLVLASAKRARQINEYAATLGLNETLGIPGPQVHTRSQHPLTIAIEELREGKLEVSLKRPRDTEEDAPDAGGDDFLSAGAVAEPAEADTELDTAAQDTSEDEPEPNGSGEDQGAA